MEKVDDLLDKLQMKDFLDQYEEVPIIAKISDKVALPARYVTLAIGVVLLLLCFTPIGMSLIYALFSFFYPAYMSYKSLTVSQTDVTKSQVGRDNNQITKWLTYWTILAIWHVFDDLVENTLGFLPYFGLIKMVSMVSLYNHKSDGATRIYENVALPLLSVAEPYIEVPIKELESLLNLTNHHA